MSERIDLRVHKRLAVRKAETNRAPRWATSEMLDALEEMWVVERRNTADIEAELVYRFGLTPEARQRLVLPMLPKCNPG